MHTFQALPITNAFSIDVYPENPNLKLTAEQIQHIDTIWKSESSFRPEGLFNGQILSVIEFDADRAIGFFTEYKYLLAQYRDPSLKKILNITPICVRAATFAGDQILFGRRSTSVTLSPHTYECVPGGGIDPAAVKEGKVNVILQLYRELEEEAHIKNPTSCRLFSLLHELEESIFEICAEIQVPEKFASKAPSPHLEHSHFDWIKTSHIREFCNTPSRAFAPTTVWLLGELHLL